MTQKVTVAIVATVKNFLNGIDQASSKLDQFSSKATAFGKTMSRNVTLPILAVGAISTKLASDVNESLNKVNVVFGESSKEIDKWSKSAAKNLGLSRGEALAAAGGFGDMFTQLGFTKKASASMSKSVLQMSADLGSFSNLDTADVSDRITAAFRGEYDSLQKVIPNINAARVESEALAATGKKTAAELTAQDKATAVLAIVSKDGAKAQGDFKKTSKDAANATKIFNAQLKDAGATIGEIILPYATKLINAASVLANKFAGLSDGQKNAVVGFGLFAAAIGPASYAVGKITKAVTTTTKAIKGTIKGVKKLKQSYDQWKSILPLLKEWSVRQIKAKVETVKTTVATVRQTIATKAQAIAAKASALATKVWTAAQAAFNAVMAANPIALIIIAVVALVAVFVLLYKKNEAFRKFVQKAWKAISDFAKKVFPAIAAFFKAAWDVIVTVAKWAWNNVIKPIWQAISAFVTNILIPAFKVIATVFSTIWNVVSAVITWAWNNIIKPIWNLISAYITNVLVPVFTAIWNVVKWVWEKVSAGIQVAWDFIKPIFQKIWDYITNTLVPIFQKIWDTVKKVWSGITSAISTAWTNIKAGFDKAKGFVTDLIDNFKKIPQKIKSIFTGAGSWLKDTGKNIIQGLIDGAGNLLSKLGKFFLDKVPSWIKAPFKKALGIKSPSKIFKQFGVYTIQGLVEGLDQKALLQKTMNKVSATVTGGYNASLGTSGSQLSYASASGSGNTYNITVNTLKPSQEVAKDIRTEIERINRLGI